MQPRAPLTSVADAVRIVTADAEPLGSETIPVAAAHGRVLARDLVALRSQPAADMSAMDGYAVRGEDIAQTPASLTVIGESAAGRPFAGRIGPGEAARIFTGALLPAGADTVVIQENVTRDGARITTTAPTAPGRNVRRAGLDFSAGKPGLSAGRRLTGRDVMLAAAMNHASLAVRRRPRVGLMQTGDELVLPGQGSGAASEVVVSNVYGIAALAAQAGAEVIDFGIVGDTLEATRAAIRQAIESGIDVLVSSGGASVGDHDLMAPALKAEGVTLALHKIALRPGKPLMYGRREAMRVIGLPGNPVSAYVCSLLFLVPLLRALQGEAGDPFPTSVARLAVDVPANDLRMDFMRATHMPGPDGLARVTPAPVQDSGMISTLAGADCLLVREADAPAAQAGELCRIVPLAD